MSLVTRNMTVQGNGEVQKQSQPATGLNYDHQLLEHAGNQQLIQQNGAHAISTDDDGSQEQPAASLSMAQQHGGSDKAPGGLADFFSQEVFHIVLHNPTTAHRLLKFSQARMCGENMEFLEKVPTPASLSGLA